MTWKISFASGEEHVEDFCEYGNEPSNSIQCGEFHD